MTDKASRVEEYLAAVPADARRVLEALRAVIRSSVPDATEIISYQVPTFRHHGGLVGYAAFADHCSFFVMSPAVMAVHKEQLEGYDTSMGTIRFTVDKPLPNDLVKTLVMARIKENERRVKR